MSTSIAGEGSPLGIGSSSVGTTLTQLLMCDDIEPGSDPSYQVCKTLYLYHPLGGKIVDSPIKLAQSQNRMITIEGSGEQDVRDQFLAMWEEIDADEVIKAAAIVCRIYGVGSIVVGTMDQEPNTPLDPWKLAASEIYFNILDPLNTSGSLVLPQNPNSPAYQKPGAITSNGVIYHKSRSCTMFNEQPIYLAYTGSAFGFSGRSVYQRALYPLKSFVQSMITDDMVTRKAGLLVAMLKGAGSIINRAMQGAAAIKRRLLKDAVTDNVLSIDLEEKIESINMQNTNLAMTTARGNIIKNIATACDMPALILEQESFAEGFGEGTEDTKNVVRYVNGVREELRKPYEFMDRICMHKAWTEEFFVTMQAKYPELYENRSYREVFLEWKANFRAVWPSLLEEPDSEKSKMEKVKVDGIIQVFSALAAVLDPENKARAAEWLMNNLNECPLLFPVPMELDIEAIAEFVQEQKDQADEAAEAALEPEPAAGGGLRAVK